MNLKCEQCGTTKRYYFYKDGSAWYCRKCIRFGKVLVGRKPQQPSLCQRAIDTTYALPYALTLEQTAIVERLRNRLKDKQKILIYAACGAGKTEIVMDSIERYIRSGKKVGYAIARRQVVLEIAQRLKAAFCDVRVVQVCANYTKITDGDLIVCTTHQLYRYPNCFDLLIMDEIDAFPYAGNEVLESLAEHACRGEMLFLTATPNTDLRRQVKAGTVIQYTLFQRPHGYPLAEPKLRRLPVWLQYGFLLYLGCTHHAKKWIVFVPTIRMAKTLYQVYRRFFSCCYITSKTQNNEQIMEAFRQGAYLFLFATTILERGITVSDVHVVVMQADHGVYSEASLIQMVGRVGRKAEAPKGLAYILMQRTTQDIQRCKQVIQRMNER